MERSRGPFLERFKTSEQHTENCRPHEWRRYSYTSDSLSNAKGFKISWNNHPSSLPHSFTAAEAESAGLVAKVFPTDELVPKTLELASKMAKFSCPVLNMAKECVNESQNLGLDSGMLFERRVFHSTWGLHDRKEGMTAFADKRKADFQNK